MTAPANGAAPIELSIDGSKTTHFNSQDPRARNPAKGLSGGVGDGQGHWWLDLRTDLDIEALGYVRTSDGFVTEMHSVVPLGEDGRYDVLFFNPASNQNVSRLRIVNPNPERVSFTIRALDDDGMREVEPFQFAILANAARTFTSSQLESRFGDGEGKWQLSVSAGRPVWVMSLMTTRSGHVTNLSLPAPDLAISEPEPPPPPPPPPPEADRAPANKAAFYALVQGKKVVVRAGYDESDYRFSRNGHFTARDLDLGVALGGRWTYTKGSRHRGNLRLNFDRVQGQDVGSCSVDFLFDSRSAGRFSAYCTGYLSSGDGTFQIVNLF